MFARDTDKYSSENIRLDHLEPALRDLAVKKLNEKGYQLAVREPNRTPWKIALAFHTWGASIIYPSRDGLVQDFKNVTFSRHE